MMAGLSRLGAGLACVLTVGACGAPEATRAPAPSLSLIQRGVIVKENRRAPNAGLELASRLTDMQLVLIHAFRAIKGGDDQQAIDLLEGAKRIVRTIDVDRLAEADQEKVRQLQRFLAVSDKEALLADLRKAIAETDEATLTARANVLLALHHYFALSKAIAAKDKDTATQELAAAYKAFAHVDFDQLDDTSRQKLEAIRQRVASWAQEAGIADGEAVAKG